MTHVVFVVTVKAPTIDRAHQVLNDRLGYEYDQEFVGIESIDGERRAFDYEINRTLVASFPECP